MDYFQVKQQAYDKRSQLYPANTHPCILVYSVDLYVC